MNHKYTSEEARRQLAREIAAEGMILLKNEDHVLPLSAGTTVAVLGQTQLSPHIGGGGSGASHSDHVLRIRTELERAGLHFEEVMANFYQALGEKLEAEAANKPDFDWGQLEGLVSSGLIYEIFGRYTPAVPEELPEEALFEASAKHTDTAIIFIGRATGGEECDRRVEDDYELLEGEKELLKRSASHYQKLIVVYNVNGMVDLSYAAKIPEVKAELFMGTAGEQEAGALADILTGLVSPSGRMVETAAWAYTDYPTAKNFSSNKDKPETILQYKDYGLSAEENGSVGFEMSPVTVYEEDIYVGYRYFDSFEKPVLYPFGHGLSYAEFETVPAGCCIADGAFKMCVKIRNVSAEYAGKQAVGLYVHAPFGELKKPAKELRAIAKSTCLAPGAEEELELSFPLKDLASFSEERNAYILEAGNYVVLLGASAAEVVPAAKLTVPETVVVREVTADIGFTAANKGKIHLLSPDRELVPECCEALPAFDVKAEDLKLCFPEYAGHDFSVEAVPSTLQDVIDGKVSIEAFVKQMSLRELAVLANGFGPGLPFGGIGTKDLPVTIQDEEGHDIGSKTRDDVNMGYCNPAIEKYGILTTFYKDGPASVGKTAWPTGRMIASTFDPALGYAFGCACGREAEELRVDSWLAPAMNLIRNPIGGRGFEYFSEDPFITGVFGTEITKGAMENNAVTTCPKHFALNEQETYRRGSAKKRIDAADSIVSARAARELYLRPFERVMTEAKPTTIMSSFNKINGAFAGGNRVLQTEILRGEWGFDGVVVTDWGDMDVVVDGADAVAAGNDVIMPGGPPVIAQVLKGYEEGRVTLDELRAAAVHLLNYVKATKAYRKD